MKYMCLVFAIFLFHVSSYASSMAKSKILHKNKVVTMYLRSFKDRDLNVSGPEVLLDASVVEFSNSNTFVELNKEKKGIGVAYKDVHIRAPGQLNSNDLMEIFLKSYAAKVGMAKSIKVVFPNSDLIFLDDREGSYRFPLFELFQVSGITHVYFENTDHMIALNDRLRDNKHSRVPEKSGYFIAGDVHVSLRNQLAQELGEKNSYSVEELLDKDEQLRGKTVYLVAPPVFPTNQTLMKTLGDIYQLSARKLAFVHLVSPYLPYARSDRPDQSKGVSAQARLVANLLEQVGMAAITVVRPHAPQTLGFYDVPSFEVTGRETINRYLRDVNVEMIVSPDAGFQKDATLYAEELGIDLAVVNKQRLSGNETRIVSGLSGTDLEKVRGKRVAVVDDETATGGTLKDVSEGLYKLGAKEIYAVVTHLAGPASKILSSSHIKKFVCTDTFPIPTDLEDKIKILPIAGEIAQKIKELESQHSSN